MFLTSTRRPVLAKKSDPKIGRETSARRKEWEMLTEEKIQLDGASPESFNGGTVGGDEVGGRWHLLVCG